MRISHALWVIALSIVSPGCALIEDGARNTYWGVCSTLETHREKRRNRQWAEAAWQEACVSLAPGQRNGDYAQGFKDGYAEYLFRGGDGEPPLIAPLRYRHLRYQNADGYRAVESWFEGYRHGAGIARDSGARRWVVGPSALHGEWREPEPLEIVRTPAPKLPPTQPPPVTSDLKIPQPPTHSLPEGPTLMIPSVVIETPRELELRVRSTPVATATDAAPLPPTSDPPAPPASDSVNINNEIPPSLLPRRARIIGVNEPSPPPQPERAKITNLIELPPPVQLPESPAPPQAERAKITNVIEPPSTPPMPERARITNVNEAPAPAMPERVRIKSVTVEPNKGQ